MTGFINRIAPLIQKYAPQYGIAVCSPIIAQAILESGHGTSELAVNANNFFGLKYRSGRCPSADDCYIKVGSEQNADGSYTSSTMKWFSFPDMEAGVIGYFDFINNYNYANLKGVTDPEQYLINIKADGYATSLNYVQNLMKVIERYNLTQYDKKREEVCVMGKKICIDAGHGLYTAGKRCMAALDPNQTREWFLNDRIADMLEKALADYDCEVLRVDDTTGAKDITLQERVKKANNWKADMYISIHHNAGLNGRKGGGTVVYYYSNKSERRKQAQALYDAIVAKTGLVGNRYDKVIKNGFYVIKNTNMPAFLIENGFMDSPTDVPIILSVEHAQNTSEAILSFLVDKLSLTKKKLVTGANNASESNVDKTYKIKVANVAAGDVLNIRKKPTVLSAKTGQLAYNDPNVYTIVEVKSGWGKLKSGIGWINLKYTKRV